MHPAIDEVPNHPWHIAMPPPPALPKSIHTQSQDLADSSSSAFRAHVVTPTLTCECLVRCIFFCSEEASVIELKNPSYLAVP